ncbi:efflux RND transporter periplasmic adaptor subunit [Pleurocapsa sp. FMAR1]|uniref:efflux RND transporter periplasmic adaptor subunit n=1 Tax=Pleurocapsa sp. FMAR1 TaxID=3040204 RepID=UPI0029C7263F|nr:efflux RND transporter periplasmic adaptor subunit [Pleurocapsa sp. FMAR1]
MIYLKKPRFISASLIRATSYAVAITLLSIGVGGCGGGKQKEANANKPQAIPVKLKTIESATVIDSSKYVGSLEARERVTLAPRVEGRIINIYATQGDRVSKGNPIVELKPTQEQDNVNAATQTVNVQKAKLGQVQAALSTAEANRAGAAADVETAKANLQDSQAQVQLAKINIKRTRFLVKNGAQAQQNLDNQNSTLKTSIAQRNSQQATLNAKIESLKASEKQIDQARANVDGQYASIKQAEAQLSSTSQNLAYNQIEAPIDGVVGNFDNKKVGDYVSAGQQLTTITNNQSFDLNINIPVEYRDRLKLGLSVETINNDGNQGVEGKITYIAPLVNQNTQSVLTKVTFVNKASLKDKEYVQVRVIWNKKPGVLVPTTAISTMGGQDFVYVAKKGNPQEKKDTKSSAKKVNPQGKNDAKSSGTSLMAQQQPIKLGNIQGQDYQVISGLRAGDRIAVSNLLNLKDGTAIMPAKSAQKQQAVSEASSK